MAQNPIDVKTSNQSHQVGFLVELVERCLELPAKFLTEIPTATSKWKVVTTTSQRFPLVWRVMVRHYQELSTSLWMCVFVVGDTITLHSIFS